MNHPMTDEMCEEIQLKLGALPDHWYYDAMRAAADWQLEQVLKWIEETEYDQYHYDKIIYASALREAMRPQEDN